MEKIQIKCPTCGLLLLVEDNPKNAGKSIICPNCKTKHKYEEFKVYHPAQASDSTEIVSEEKNRIGRLRDMATGKEYLLKEGSNTIGRMTYKSEPKASLLICTSDMGFSRLHARIDVMKGRDGYFHTYISNAENKNATYINSEQLLDDDKIALRDGDIIRSSETRLSFIVGAAKKAQSRNISDDDDKTEI